MSISSLLLIGYKLSLLTFSLGTLVYALPIPWRGLKAWGPRLIWDSIASMVLISIYYIIVKASNMIPLILGGSWPYFLSWLKSLIMFSTGLKELVIIAYAATRSLGPLKVLSSLLWPIDRLSNVLWIFIATIYGLAIFIKRYYYILIALGIAIYALPLRLGRSAGAWLIAFAVVFNSGLPLLPVFISTFYGSNTNPKVSPIVNLGLIYAEVNVSDLLNTPMNYGVAKFYIIDNGNPTLVGKYIITENGLLRSKYLSNYVALPSRKDIYGYIEIDSLQMPLYPYPFSSAYSSESKGVPYFKLKAKNIIWHKNGLIIVSNSTDVQVIDIGSDRLKAKVNGSDYFIEIRSPEKCKYELLVKGDTIRKSEGNWSWLDVKGSFVKYYLKGSSELYLKILNDCTMNPSYPESMDYYMDFLSQGIFLDINLIRSIIVMYLTIPLFYVFLLFSVSYALARLLGGRERILPRFI